MKILLLNDNPVVTKLVTLSAQKTSDELSVVDSIDAIDESSCDLLVIDDTLFNDETFSQLQEKLTFSKSLYICSRDSKKEDGFTNTIKKPFLPTDLVELFSTLGREVSEIQTQALVVEDSSDEIELDEEIDLDSLDIGDDIGELDELDELGDLEEDSLDELGDLDEELSLDDEISLDDELSLDDANIGILDKDDLQEVQDLLDDDEEVTEDDDFSNLEELDEELEIENLNETDSEESDDLDLDLDIDIDDDLDLDEDLESESLEEEINSDDLDLEDDLDLGDLELDEELSLEEIDSEDLEDDLLNDKIESLEEVIEDSPIESDEDLEVESLEETNLEDDLNLDLEGELEIQDIDDLNIEDQIENAVGELSQEDLDSEVDEETLLDIVTSDISSIDGLNTRDLKLAIGEEVTADSSTESSEIAEVDLEIQQSTKITSDASGVEALKKLLEALSNEDVAASMKGMKININIEIGDK